MGEFEDYYANAGAALPQTETQRSMQQYVGDLSGEEGGEFTNYYKQQDEKKKAEKLARQQANLTRINAKTAKLQGEADAATGPLGYGRAAMEGLSTGASDIFDTATLGGYRKARDYALEKLAPDSGQGLRETEAGIHAPVSNPLMRAAQISGNAANTAAGSLMGAPALLGKAGMAVTEAAAPYAAKLAPRAGRVISEALGGGVSGGLAEAGTSAIAGDDPETILKKTALGAGGGAVLAPALGAAGRGIMGSPARRQEATVDALLEHPMQSTKLRKFVPREEEIRKQLAGDKEFSDLVRNDPKAAAPAAEQRLQQVNDRKLEPFYAQATLDKADGVPFDKIERNLTDLKGNFTESAEKAQRAAIDSVISDMKSIADRNGGAVPAQILRKESTQYQMQGYVNAPQFSSQPVMLAKKAKQGIGNSLRGSVADHLGDVYGQGTVAEFRQANKEVSAWFAIRDLATETAERMKTNSPSMSSALAWGKSAVKHPIAKVALPSIGYGAESIDQNILPMLAESPNARTIGRGIQQAAPAAAVTQVDMLQRAREEKLRRDREAAGMLYQE